MARFVDIQQIRSYLKYKYYKGISTVWASCPLLVYLASDGICCIKRSPNKAFYKQDIHADTKSSEGECHSPLQMVYDLICYLSSEKIKISIIYYLTLATTVR
ncbi:MAG: hypothetical protein F6K39_39780 [Okeania sp. SIO3B3]|nr:hypothetical protein [Okeania sp. SIO3B3]